MLPPLGALVAFRPNEIEVKDLAVLDCGLEILPTRGVVRIHGGIRLWRVAGGHGGVRKSLRAEIQVDAAGVEIIHEDAGGAGVVRGDALGVRGGIESAEALELGEGIRHAGIGGEDRSPTGRRIFIAAGNRITAEELDVNLAGIEAGLVVEKDRHSERVHGLLSECRSGSAGSKNCGQQDFKKRIFIHYKEKGMLD